MKSTKIKTTNTGVYNGAYMPGNLKGDTFVEVGNVHGCRETFMSAFLRGKIKEKSAWFGLFINANQFRMSEFRMFLRAVENRMKIKGTIIIRPSTKRGIVFVGVTDWWLGSKIRQEFLTILLRCYSKWRASYPAAKFDKKNIPIDNILYSYNYFSETKPAVERFLSGFNLLKNKAGCEGWYRNFRNNKDPMVALVKKLAIKPDAGAPAPADSSEPPASSPSPTGATVMASGL